MRRLCDIEKIESTARILNKKFGKGTFTRKEFDKLWTNDNKFCLQTLLDYKFIKVANIEYFDIPNCESTTNTYCTKGNERILVNSNFDRSIFEKYGFKIEKVNEKIKGKRYFYIVDYDLMKENFNKSKREYLQNQYDLIDKQKAKIALHEQKMYRLETGLTFEV